MIIFYLVPSEPRNFRAFPKTSTSIELQWGIPEYPNGKLQKYEVGTFVIFRTKSVFHFGLLVRLGPNRFCCYLQAPKNSVIDYRVYMCIDELLENLPT